MSQREMEASKKNVPEQALMPTYLPKYVNSQWMTTFSIRPWICIYMRMAVSKPSTPARTSGG
jgi:hypothetical protein